MADWTPQSRAEEILFKTINGEPYDGLPQSRIEELLLELKEVIEQGGGGGGGKGTKDIYSNSETLTNKVWLGLPVYRKLFVFDEPIRVGDSWITTPADVSDLNIDYITDAIIIGKDIYHPDNNALCVTAVVNGESKKIDIAAPGYNYYVKMICIEYVKKALSEEKKSTRKSTKKEDQHAI